MKKSAGQKTTSPTVMATASPVAFWSCTPAAVAALAETACASSANCSHGRPGYHAKDDDEADRLGDAMMELEKQISAIPAVTAQEFATKVIAATSYSAYTLDDSPVMNEAVALVGAVLS
jgi:hypothetical protein